MTKAQDRPTTGTPTRACRVGAKRRSRGLPLTVLLAVSPLGAATIVVDSTTMTIDAGTCTDAFNDIVLADLPGADGLTTLPEAMCAANGTPGEDTIELQDSVYSIAGPHNFWYGPTGLPAISSVIVIEGNGAVVERAAGAPKLRLLYVAGTLHPVLLDAPPPGGTALPLSPGNLTLRNLTLRGGLARGGQGGGAGLGGAIYNQGTLLLEAVTATSNEARGGNGDIDGSPALAGGGLGGDGADNSSPQQGGGGFATDGGSAGGSFLGGEGGAALAGGVSALGGDGGSAVLGGGGGGGFAGDGSPGDSTTGAAGADGGGDATYAIGGTGGGGGLGGGGGPGDNGNYGGGGGGVGGGGGGAFPGGDGGYGGAGGGSGDGGFAGGAGVFGGAGGFGGGGGGSVGGVGGAGGAFGGAGGDTGGTSDYDAIGAGGGGGLGGVLFNHFGSSTLRNSTLTGNTARGGDGGGNSNPAYWGGGGGAGLGGAIFNLNGTVVVEMSTLAANTALGGAGGGVSGRDGQGAGASVFQHFQDTGVGNSIAMATAASTSLSIEASILADGIADPATPPVPNTFDATNDCFKSAGTTATLIGSNLIESNATGANACGSPTLAADPGLAPLADNGGPTETMAIGTASPAFEAALGCASSLTDQRGLTRPQLLACDLGAFELSESVADRDFGDAPDTTYPTRFADDGARHLLSPLFLGACVDAEADGQATATADGDDVASGSSELGTCAVAGDDEDGVVFTSALVPEASAFVDVTASAASLLDAWVDFDASGTWEAGEQVFASQVVVAGANALSFAVPAGAAVGATFARFRLSTDGGLAVSGFASDGEVEDHAVAILPPIVISVDDVALAEGDAGPTAFDFTVTVASTAIPVAVTVTTVNGTATSPADFAPVGPTVLVFAQGGPPTQTFTVAVAGEGMVEPDETFTVVLTDPSAGAVVLDPSGLGTIVDDDEGVFGATLEAHKRVSGTALVGAAIHYVIEVTNLGPGAQADNPGDELVDLLPPEVALLGASADVGVATADPTTNTVSWNGALEPGEVATIEITAEVLPAALGASVSNQATLFFDTNNDGNNDGSALSDDPEIGGAGDPTTFVGVSFLEIPTLGNWGLMAMAVALGLLGLRRSGRRHPLAAHQPLRVR